MPELEDSSSSSRPPPRNPRFSVVDFATDEELKQHLAPEDVRFTSRRMVADLEHLFGSGSRHAARDWTVLELGSAFGQTAAVLSRLFKRVISVELLPGMAEQRRQTHGDLGNVFWLTLDLYRDPWPSFVEGNAIDVAFVDAMHSEEAVAADLRHCAELRGLRFAIVHDYNFIGTRRAVRRVARHFAFLAPMGEAQRAPLEERPPGAERFSLPKFPEAALLRPLGLAANSSGSSWRRVAAAAKRLRQDPEVAAVEAEADAADRKAFGSGAEGSEPEPHFRELCGASFSLAGKDTLFSKVIRVRFRCNPRSAGRRGMVFFDEAGTSSRADWRVRKDDTDGEGWIELRNPTRRGGNRTFAVLPAISRRALLWVPSRAKGVPLVAVEDSKLIRDVRTALGRPPLQAYGPWGPAVGLEHGWAPWAVW